MIHFRSTPHHASASIPGIKGPNPAFARVWPSRILDSAPFSALTGMPEPSIFSRHGMSRLSCLVCRFGFDY